MRYAEIQEFEVNNGEGVGCSLFVQGCHFHCKNCFNQSAWDFNDGERWTNEIKERFIELVKRPYITRVSILGGEPLADENVCEIYDLLSYIKTMYDKKIWVYTGYTWEELVKESRLFSMYSLNSFLDKKNEEQFYNAYVRSLIIPLVDVLIDGRFVEEQKDLTLPFRGSSNQRVIDVAKTIERGEITEHKINNN